MAPAPTDQSWAESNGIFFVPVDPAADQVAEVSRLVAYVRKHDIDGVINNDNPVVQNAIPFLSCPVSVVCHCNETTIFSLAGHNWEYASHVVALSSDMQVLLARRFGIPPSSCPIVYGSTDDRGADLGPRPNGNRPLRVIVGSDFGRLKGGDILARQFSELDSLPDGVEAHWFGRMPDNVRHRLSGNPRVFVHGRVPREDFLADLRLGDIFLMPSKSEGCPIALLEAMSFGLVPIVSDGKGAMRWIVRNGHNGFVCRLSNWAKESRECLHALKADADRLASMRQAARSTFLESYQSDRLAEEHLRLLSQAGSRTKQAANSATIVQWHRGARPGLLRSRIDRFCYRYGLLRTVGQLRWEAIEG